jgi:hypothetical protein
MPPHIFDPERQLLPLLERLFGHDRLLFGRLLDTDEKGIPYIDDWFQQGIELSERSLVVWINGDIIIPKGWFPRVKFVYDRFSGIDRQFAVLSRRCDFNVSLENLSNFFDRVSELAADHSVESPLTDYSFLKSHYFDSNEDTFGSVFNAAKWPPDFDALAGTRALHTTWGMDTFVISTNVMELNFDEMPPFHMGRYRWDPWIAGWLGAQIPVTTLGDDFCTYHIDHTPTIRDVSRPKVRENIEYGARCNRFLASNEDSEFYFEGRGFFERKGRLVLEKIPDSIPKGNAPEPSD